MTVLGNAYPNVFWRYFGGGSDDPVEAMGLMRNIKVYALMQSNQITGSSAQLAGYGAALTL